MRTKILIDWPTLVSGGCMLAVCLLLAGAGVPVMAQVMQKGPVRNPHGALDMACNSCHTSTSWSPLRAMPEFSHDKTRFPLRGMHQNVSCTLCHTNLVFTNVGTKCADCHADIHRRQFGPRCEECHSVKGWRSSVQNLKAHQNRFPLLGAHAAVDCEACHRGAGAAVFTGLRTDCASCHLRDFENAKPLDHRAAKFPATCEQCHTFNSWVAVNFDHSRFTGFALMGAHTRLECAACHPGNRYQGTSAECYGCHVKDFNATVNPNHPAAGFSTACSVCHTTTTWSGAKFDHNTATRFTLTGAHAQVACASCHVGNKFAGTATACEGCHLPDFNKTTNPNHVRANFPQACGTCHNTANWQNATFDHGITKFPLTGAHVQVSCQQCHAGNNFSNTPGTCVGCHLADFTKAANPNHVSAGFPQACETCHNTTQWQGAKFDHNTATKFALTGAHPQVACNQCHLNNVFAGTSKVCQGCHMPEFNRTTHPNHLSAAFPRTCEGCHSTASWSPAAFDHNAATKFALVGAHTRVECAQCHQNGVFSGTPAQCSGCHLSDFNKTTKPNHVSAGFPQACEVCHSSTAWIPATYDHSKTRFPLTGMHTNTQCAQCHTNNIYAGTPAACSGCHLTDFNNSKNPNHAASGFPQTCETCHSTAAWRPATFDHSKTKFPLTGMHTNTQCAQCHTNNIYAGTPAVCSGCHLTDFNNSKNPNHAASGFPQTCETCHSTAAWRPATFDHSKTKFPLTGMHTNTQCAQCHTNNIYAGTPAVCSGCHLTDFNNSKNPNHVAAGFPQTCETCHTTASWQGAKFDHNTATKFQLVGAHVTVPCAQCHVNNVFAGTSNLCAGCHLTDFNKSTNPNHVTGGFPQTCETCHTSVAWRPATFDHSKTRFPLTGMHTNTQCAQCHKNNIFTGTTMLLLGLPPGPVQRDYQPQPQDRRVPPGLLDLPLHHRVDPGCLRPLQDEVSAYRRPCAGGVRRVPHQ